MTHPKDKYHIVTTHIKPTSRGLSAGSMNLAASMDPADKPRDVGVLGVSRQLHRILFFTVNLIPRSRSHDLFLGSGFWHRIVKTVLYSFLLMMFSVVSFALPSDQKQIMHLVADSADLSQQKHKGIYTGHVELMQGTTNLSAARAVTKGDIKNQLTLAIAWGEQGKQAHYWTRTDPTKPPFHAWADTIRYYPLRHLIELTGNARIEQGENSLSAYKISYDTLEQHVTSQSDKNTRTTIILYPEKKLL